MLFYILVAAIVVSIWYIVYKIVKDSKDYVDPYEGVDPPDDSHTI